MYKAIKRKYLSQEKQTQAKYVFVGFIIASIASIDFLPKYGIKIYPFGYIFMLIWISIVTYAILKHHLMDINIVFRKGLVYSILIAIITLIYLITVLIFERLLQGIVGYQSLIVSILTALIIALIFIPLKNIIQNFVDGVFFKGTFAQIAKEKELMQQELERSERLKAVATFASGLSHEIKNPLTAVKTFSEFLPEKLNDKDFLMKFSKIVGSEVSRIDDLVHQLLDFAKPAPLKIQTVDIHNLLDDTINFLNNELLKHRIKLIKEYQATSSNLQVDTNKLKQAFLNLFLNAIDAMPNGGTLTIETSVQGVKGSSDQVNLHSDTRPLGHSVTITVSDTGCGIPSKDLPHIFEPFQSSKESGTGLGLSITYSIIKEHQGEIAVESVVGKGTKFVLELPLSRV